MQTSRQRGFTLIEVLITLTIITTMAVITLGALSPWLDVRQQFETERKLAEVRDALRAYYGANAFAVEQGGDQTFGAFAPSVVAANAGCTAQDTAFSTLGFTLSDAGAKAAQDGYANPFCVFIGPTRAKRVDGVDLFYRSIAIVSTGSNGVVDPLTKMNADDSLTLDADDKGVVVSTLDMSMSKYALTAARLQRIADNYTTYFTARFLQSADRDINRYYFSRNYEPVTSQGTVGSTVGTPWAKVTDGLASIGVTPDLGSSAWEVFSDIEFENFDQPAAGAAGVPVVFPKSPGHGDSGQLPYTALIRARVPAPPGVAPQYAVRAAIGQY